MKKFFVLLISVVVLILIRETTLATPRLDNPVGELITTTEWPNNLLVISQDMMKAQAELGYHQENQSQQEDSTIPPPEVRWSITGLIVLGLFLLLFYMWLKGYKSPPKNNQFKGKEHYEDPGVRR